MTTNLKKTAEVILKEVKNTKQQRKEAIKVWLSGKRNRTFSPGLI